MVRLSRLILSAALPIVGSFLGLGISGCASPSAGQTANSAVETANATAQSAANTAQGIVQGAVAVAASLVPTPVWNQASQLLHARGLNWGKPAAIYTADQMYVFVYPSPYSMIGRPQPRILVINALGRTARLQRMQEQGY